MASKSLGTLTLDLVARIGGYTAGLEKAEREAQKRAAAIEKVFDKAAVGVGVAFGLMATAAVGAFAAINQGIEEAAKFSDLADMTGAAAEDLAGLKVAADVAGVSIEDVAGAMNKLTKNLEEVSKPGNDTAQALGNLGINIKEFLALDPAGQFNALSEAFNKYGDSAAKVQNAQALFGKSGAEQLKVFKALQDQGGALNILTKEQIKLADDYGDASAAATSKLKLYAAALSTEVIPAMTAVKSAATDLIKQLIDANKATSDLSLNLTILDWAEKVALALGTITEAAIGVGKAARAVGGSFESVFADASLISKIPLTAGGAVEFLRGGGLSGLKEALDNRNKVAAEANKRYEDLWNYDGTQITKTIKKSFDNQKAIIKNMQDPEIRRLLARSNAQNGPLPELKGITPAPTKTGGSDDPTKKLLDNQLKLLKDQANEAKDIAADRNKTLDLYNQQGLLSFNDYYNGIEVAQSESFAVQKGAIAAQIQLLQQYQAAASKQTDRAEAQGKINDLLAQQSKLERDSAQQVLQTSFARQKATEQYQKQLQELNAQVLEMKGNLVEAAEIRFDLSNLELRKKLLIENNQEAIKQLDYLKQMAGATAQFAKEQANIGRTNSDLQRAEERIAREQQLGITGTIDGLVKLGEARQRALEGMKGSYSEFQKLQESGVEFTADQKRSMEQLKYEIEDLSTRLDPLAEKFNTMFGDKFSDAIGSIIDGTKSVKAALKDMVNSFITDLAKLAAQDVAKSLFSGGGSATGGVGFDFGSLLSSLFSGARANGGPVMPNSLYRVNEKGPEIFQAANGSQYLMTGAEGGTVHANSGGGFNQQNTFVVQGTIDHRTETQVAAKVRQQTNTAARRFA